MLRNQHEMNSIFFRYLQQKEAARAQGANQETVIQEEKKKQKSFFGRIKEYFRPNNLDLLMKFMLDPACTYSLVDASERKDGLSAVLEKNYSHHSFDESRYPLVRETVYIKIAKPYFVNKNDVMIVTLSLSQQEAKYLHELPQEQSNEDCKEILLSALS